MRYIFPVFLLLIICVAAHAIDRPADPIVLTGADVSAFDGIATDDLVAFQWTGAAWQQVPVQVDERAVIDFTDVYNGNTSHGNFTRLDYADAGTFTGPDADPALDSDDEIVFMVKDLGAACTAFSEPAGVVADSGVELKFTDPLDASTGYIYLFQQAGSLDPGAGEEYVVYQFNLLSGDYLTTYDLGNNVNNPEDSFITSTYYQRHFADRWKIDETSIYAGSATGVDILDRHKNMFAPGDCGRTEDTFSSGEGGFIINKSGPVRAIRSYVGANSGPRTQRAHLFYEQREDMLTYLRVHAISSVMDIIDYSPAAAGMTYYSSADTSGAVIDGVNESVTAGEINWEMVTGAQGSLVMVFDFYATIADTSYTSYWLDDSAPSVTQCTGDAFAYGTSGAYVNHFIENTDPASSPYALFEMTRITYYEAPGAATSDAVAHRQHRDNPLTFASAAWDSTVDTDGDGVPDVTDPFPTNADEWEDADGDGLGDNFEQTIIAYDSGDAIASLADVLPGDDFDVDGVINSDEFRYRTDPTDGSTVLPAAGILAAALASALAVWAGLRVLRKRAAKA